ncbi:serine/threonine-protein kinase [Bifidobacterium crudilactis]
MEPMSDLSVLNLTPGQQVGGYTLVARLGGGAMGSVWSVTDDGGQMYAMKILRDSLNDQTDESDVSGSRDHDSEGYERVNARERLRREALALRKINHPGVCNIVDMELDDALAFIVTELIEGKTLRDDVAANGRYTGDDLERLSRKLMDAVRAVHAAGIVHRDIKPTNVMISSRGPVLVDFGIAMGAGESHVTRTGLVMGTPGFIAPEIIDGEESDAGADWWSTAAVLAFAATGKAVFGVKPMMAVLERAASGNADLSGLPTGTLTAFRKALAPKRQDRCSPDELLRAITLDAMVPELWQTDVAQEHQSPDTPSENSQAGDSGASNDANPSETAVMRPFGGSSSGTETLPALAGNTVPLEAERASANNPRRLWERQEAPDADSDDETAIFAPMTATMPQSQFGQMNPDDAGDHTAVLNGAFPQNPESADSGTMDDASRASETTIGMPPTVPQAAWRPDTPTSAYPAYQQDSDARDDVAAQPRTFTEACAVFRSRGNLVIACVGILLAVIAASLPTVAMMLCTLVLWSSCTQGMLSEARLSRQERRGGRFTRADGILSLTSLPWYLLKSLILAIPRMLLSLLIVVIIATSVAVLWDMPVITGSFNAFGIVVHIPLLGGRPLGASGLTLGLAVCISWLAVCISPKSDTLKLGAGRLLTRYQGIFDAESEHEAEGQRRRLLIMLLACLIVIIAAIAVAASKQSVDWTPIPLLES